MMDSMCGLGMLLAVLLFVVGVVAGIYLLVRAVRGDDRRTPDDESGRSGAASQARTILEQRYASGEIDREEFDDRRRTLGV